MPNKIFLAIRSKLYFIPAAFSLVFAILALAFYLVDHAAGPQLAIILPDFLLSSREVGAAIITTTVGSLLTMLTITFSIMMVVLTIYGNQLSPNSLQDFLEKRVTLRILGYFIGALVFSIISVFTVKSEQYSNPVLSPLVCIILLVIAVVLFAYFIHFIAKSIQVTIYIQTLVNETAERIDKAYKAADSDPAIQHGSLDAVQKILDSESIVIEADKSGFVQHYDEKKLFALAKEHHLVINCVNMLGQHVLEGEPLLKIYKGEKLEQMAELDDLKKQMLDLVLIGDETNLYEDIGAGSRKLVEIAVKALSPGINNPSTAKFSIEQIGFLLQKVARGQEAKFYIDSNEHVHLIVQGLTFDRLLFYHFYQIKHYGGADLMILDAIIGALITIAADAGSPVLDQVWSFGEYLFSDIELSQYPALEKSYLRERFFQLSRACGRRVSLTDILKME